MKDEKRDEDLSDEDSALKQRLELYVDRVQHSDPEQQKVALENMRSYVADGNIAFSLAFLAKQEICDTTSSVTVLKPLKFLRPHYGTLHSHYEKVEDSDLKKLLADILSVPASTMSPHGERASLKYRLLGSVGDICSWGHEYVRNLAGEISQEYEKRLDENAKCNDLNELVEEIVPFYMKHNAEPEAVDLSLESDRLEPIEKNVDNANYERTCLYLTSFMKYCILKMMQDPLNNNMMY